MKKEDQPKKPDSFSGFFIMVSEFTDKLSEVSKRLDNITGQDDSDELYTIDQFCKKLHISKRTFFEWKRKSLISCVQIGSKIMIRQSSLNKFLDEHQS